MQKELTLIMVSVILMAVGLIQPSGGKSADTNEQTLAKSNFLRNAAGFVESTRRLRMAVIHSKNLTGGNKKLLTTLSECRLSYKKIESFLCWFFPNVAAGINGPPVYEGEEPFMEYQEPRGLQVMEALLTAKDHLPDRQRLQEQADLLAASADAIPTLLYKFSVNDEDLMQIIRLGVIRMSTLGITGYDAPALKTGLNESVVVCDEIIDLLSGFSGNRELLRLAGNMSRRLKSAGGFNAFDRAGFLTGCVIPFQQAIRCYCENNHIELPAAGLLQSGVTDIFSVDALRPANVFPGHDALVTLGKKWFSDKSLSRSGTRSCASCHQPDKAFTDGFAVSVGIDPKKLLNRNAPTLLYSGYQYRQFWDGRATGLTSQIFAVLHNPLEMDIDSAAVQRQWQVSSSYRELLAAAFPGSSKPNPSEMIGMAIGAYINTLGHFDAPFDRYMQGDSTALGVPEKNGFNLFMGKGRCATCHFAPLFNGTLPPGFDRTEFEVLGVTADTRFNRPALSPDAGRYSVYPLPFNRRAFKTPTVRNAALTAPYMHHGRFGTLGQVLTFYNNGGGAGMGLPVPNQTLSRDSLQLDQTEMKELIAFISALTDKSQRVKQ